MSRQLQAFWTRVGVREPADCWLWAGAATRQGYGKLKIGGRAGRFVSAHRHAWTLTYGEIPAGMRVCHRCDVRLCCNPSHFFLGTAADNSRDAVSKGRLAKGERNGQARLTAERVREIRNLKDSGLLQREIAKRFGISQIHVSQILLRKRWAHLPDDRELRTITEIKQREMAS